MTDSCTITVAGQPIRLYPAPKAGPAFPWVAFDDLLRAAEFPPASVGEWAWRWLSLYPDQSHSLADGQLLVSSESARGLLEHARLLGWEQADRALKELQTGYHSYFVTLHRHLCNAAFRIVWNQAALRSVPTDGALH